MISKSTNAYRCDTRVNRNILQGAGFCPQKAGEAQTLPLLRNAGQRPLCLLVQIHSKSTEALEVRVLWLRRLSSTVHGSVLGGSLRPTAVPGRADTRWPSPRSCSGIRTQSPLCSRGPDGTEGVKVAGGGSEGLPVLTEAALMDSLGHLDDATHRALLSASIL